jgi:hypothetical protein
VNTGSEGRIQLAPAGFTLRSDSEYYRTCCRGTGVPLILNIDDIIHRVVPQLLDLDSWRGVLQLFNIRTASTEVNCINLRLSVR